jgi:predicted nucleic acid-binding protein
VRFWDSSALVPLMVRQSESRRIAELYRSDTSVLAFWATRVECCSAIARLERRQELAHAGTQEALHRLDQLARTWHEVQPSEPQRETARRLLRTHDLRAADALQLAAAFTAAEQRPSTLEFVCLDDRLATAAEREGFPVLR